jgi:hypothetical protein
MFCDGSLYRAYLLQVVEVAMLVWSSRAHVLVLARLRRPRGVTLTRLTDSVRCHISVANRAPNYHNTEPTPLFSWRDSTEPASGVSLWLYILTVPDLMRLATT